MSTFSTAGELNRQIEREVKRLKKVLVDYEDKDKRKITRAAAQPIARKARTKGFAFNDSKRPHYRGKTPIRQGEPNGIKYNPGNLRRSIKVLRLRRTTDAYIGPQRARRKATEYGKPGQAVDGYYAAMLFGSQGAFRRRVLEKALRAGSSAALRTLRKQTEKAILARGGSQGF